MSTPLLVSHGHLTGLGYHGTLLGDPLRIDAYDRAIRALVRPGATVLDLGCGTGILSLLAARRGARVIAVESMPVAAVAARLFADNGLSDRITLLQADLASLPPQPVDLIVSEFMGRFVDDDGMLPTVSAAASWLAPGGRYAPHTLTRSVAPVGDTHLPELARFSDPLLGVRLSAAQPAVRAARYGQHLGPNALIAEPQVYDRFSLPDLPSPTGPLRFTIDRPGSLDGIAGWFSADLAPGVSLSTGPGHDTHWGQMVFPLPPTDALPGDTLTAWLRPEGGRWRWRVTLRRGPDTLLDVDQQSLAEAPPVTVVPPTWTLPPASTPPAPVLPGDDRVAAINVINQQAVAAYSAGSPDEAAALLGAVTAALRPDDDPHAVQVYENLGIFQMARGRYRAAAQCFLRAVDGGVGTAQSRRLLVDCFVRLGQPHNAASALNAFEAAFGPHPDGWTAATVAPCCGNARR